MNILIVEDEELTARKLQRFVEQVEPTANVIGITGSVEEAVAWLRQNGPGRTTEPELLLMDIELADGQSFAIFSQVPVNCPVIFITAYDEFAIQAFKVNSIDYLLKPVKVDDLRQAFAKLHALQTMFAPQKAQLTQLLAFLTGQGASTQRLALPAKSDLISDVEHSPLREYPLREHPLRERFLVKQGQRLIPVSVDEVAYFYSRNRLSFIKTFDEHDWMVDYTMDELADMVDQSRFFRLNRQVIAELQSIEKVHLHFNGKLKINLRPLFDDEVMVSRDKAGEFKIWLGE